MIAGAGFRRPCHGGQCCGQTARSGIFDRRINHFGRTDRLAQIETRGSGLNYRFRDIHRKTGQKPKDLRPIRLSETRIWHAKYRVQRIKHAAQVGQPPG